MQETEPQQNLFGPESKAYGEHYQDHVLEQYKLYVELADRVSQRRMLANSLFVSAHTALITGVVLLITQRFLTPNVISCVPFAALLLLCFLWWRTVASYRQLNSGKFLVIHEIEKQLPLNTFSAEWHALGRGKNRRLYRPISHVENWLPVSFALLYVVLAALLFLTAHSATPTIPG